MPLTPFIYSTNIYEILTICARRYVSVEDTASCETDMASYMSFMKILPVCK